jgi:hypothetical protein
MIWRHGRLLEEICAITLHHNSVTYWNHRVYMMLYLPDSPHLSDKY